MSKIHRVNTEQMTDVIERRTPLGLFLTKAEALFKALDYYLMRTDEKYVSWSRMSEIATVLKDGLIEDGLEEAYRYMADVVELSDAEAEYFGLDMERYRKVTNEDTLSVPSSTGGDDCPVDS